MMIDRDRRTRFVERARAWLAQDPVVLDLETTGIGPWDQAVQVGAVDTRGNVVFHSLIRPTRPIPADAIAIHGITNEAVSLAPTGIAVLEELLAVIAGRLVCTYNAAFDLRLLRQTARAWGMVLPELRVECIMQLYSEWAGQWDTRHGSLRWHSLRNAAKDCHLGEYRAHDALEDARLAARLLRYIAGEPDCNTLAV
jgi:DNA polymerase III epsilon subunit-like protein